MSIELRDANDIKVFILYLLNNLDLPLDFDTLSEIIFTGDFVRHFDFADYFADLLDRGLIDEISEGRSKKYIISSTGKIALDGVEDRLLTLVKDQALIAATRFLEYKKRGLVILSRIEKMADESDEGVMLYCDIKDNIKTIFSLETYVGSHLTAEKMKAVFEKRAEKLCSQFHALLSEDMLLL